MPTHVPKAAPFSYFGGSAALYDQSRPEYPDAMIARIVAAMPGREVLDVGCGTGIEARQFQARGCSVLGVDPDENLARHARETGVEVEVSAFEAWNAGNRLFDAVVAGTAWHWVDPLAGAAKAARVLRPGGVLAPFHHSAHNPPWLTETRLAAARCRPGRRDPPRRISRRRRRPTAIRPAGGNRPCSCTSRCST